jgi:heptosyltransferase II
MFSNLVIRGTNWVGDSIITIPALRELRRIFPEARLTLLVRPWVGGIFEGSGLVDDLLFYDNRETSFLEGVKRLKAGKFDAAILFQNAFEAAALTTLARIPKRFGFPTESRGPMLTTAIPLEEATRRKHQIYYYLDLVSRLEEILFGRSNVNYETLDYRLPVTEAAQVAALAKIPDLETGRKIVALVPGAANSRAKQWPPASFAGLIDLFSEREDCALFLLGAPNERPLCEEIAGMAKRGRARVLAGDFTLSESIAFLSKCDAVISNDTGPAYITAALDRPLLTLFGPTDPNMISPFSKTARQLRKLVHCAPCMLRDCPIDHRCLTGITPEMAFTAASAMLEEA